MLLGSLQQRQQQLNLMGMRMASGAGLGGVAPGAAAAGAGPHVQVPDAGGIYYYGPGAAPSLFPPNTPLAASATIAPAPQMQPIPQMPMSAHFAGGAGGSYAHAQPLPPPPAAFGVPPPAAMNPNGAAAAAPSYQQLMARNQMLEAKLQAVSAKPLAPSEASSKAPGIATPSATTNGATSKEVGDQKPSADSAPVVTNGPTSKEVGDQ